MKKILTVVALSLAIVAPAFAADDAKSIAQRLADKWVEAYNKGDAEALTRLYTSDAVLMPQGVPQPITGQTDIRKFFQGWLKQKLENGALPISEAKMLDRKTLFSAGTWVGDVPGQNDHPSTHLTGTWLNVMVKDGSEWRLRADTWNMMPPPGPEPVTAAASSTTGSGSSVPPKK